MNRVELARAVAQRTGVKVKEVQKVLEASFGAIGTELQKGDVVLHGLGRFRKKLSKDGSKTIVRFTQALRAAK